MSEQLDGGGYAKGVEGRPLRKRRRFAPYDGRRGVALDRTAGACIGRYMHIGHFMCTNFKAELQKALQKFDGVKRLIVDLRGNGGGNDGDVKTLFAYFYDAEYKYETAASLPVVAEQAG